MSPSNTIQNSGELAPSSPSTDPAGWRSVRLSTYTPLALLDQVTQRREDWVGKAQTPWSPAGCGQLPPPLIAMSPLRATSGLELVTSPLWTTPGGSEPEAVLARDGMHEMTKGWRRGHSESHFKNRVLTGSD